MRQNTQGFTAVELLIAIVVGSLLFMSAYQLYVNVTRQSSDAQWRSVASNVAYDILRSQQSKSPSIVKSPCVPVNTSSVAIPSYSQLSGATATITVTCPYSTTTSLTLLTVAVNYTVNGQNQVVYRAITSAAN